MRRALRWISPVGSALVATLVIAGCGRDKMQPTITKDEAVQQVGRNAQEAFQQLPGGAVLRPDGESRSLPCDDADDGGPAGRTFVEFQYTIDYPPAWPVDQALPTLADYWKEQGYRDVRDNRDDAVNPELVVERPDGFRISVGLSRRSTGTTDARLLSSSPCVWENGTPG